MRFPRRHLAAVLVALSCAVSSCRDDPPEREMQQAQSAIEAARAAGAEQLAREEYAAAQESLKRARTAVDQRDYRLALNNALDSREHAQTATKQTNDIRTKGKAESDRAIREASNALADARVQIKAGAAAHPPA